MHNYHEKVALYGTGIIGSVGIVYGILAAVDKAPLPSVGMVVSSILVVGVTVQRASEYKHGFDLDSMDYIYSPAYSVAVAILGVSLHYSSVVGGFCAAILTTVITWMKFS